jgi:predicted HNH restriction endonuclease
MTQCEKLKSLLIDFCNQRESRTFSLRELNEAYRNFDNISIGGRTPQATVRRLLQELRDLNFISFMDNSGNYTLRGVEFLEKEKNELSSIDFSKETPQKREYLFETYVRNISWARQAKRILGEKCLCRNCNNSFITDTGNKYIEVHHIIPLFQGGEDSIWNLSVLCAHHHRMAHFAEVKERIALEKYLIKEVACKI